MGKTLHNKIDKKLLKLQISEDNTLRTTISFYKYNQINNPKRFRDEIYQWMDQLGVLGRIYVSYEGINAQISVPNENWDNFVLRLYSIDFLNQTRLNIAREDNGKSFFVLKIKVRNKIVMDGLDDSTFDVTKNGIHLDAKEFNEITDLPNTILIDMRNHYESEVGHFKGAITPDVEKFKDELPLVESMLQGNENDNIVLYCTGGIRCEKASAYYKHKGFKNVYQLNGGIIEYARQVEEQGLENKFIGKNFVFDDRLGERITKDIIAKCHQCGKVSDNHTNCANDACHILFIQCESCASKYENTCSEKCQNFNKLPIEKRKIVKAKTQFNGTKFGKGRYKAHNKKFELKSK